MILPVVIQLEPINKNPLKVLYFQGIQNVIRGFWRIRTAVDGFADRCLATRPRNLVWFCVCKGKTYFGIDNYLQQFFLFFRIFSVHPFFFSSIIRRKSHPELQLAHGFSPLPADLKYFTI